MLERDAVHQQLLQHVLANSDLEVYNLVAAAAGGGVPGSSSSSSATHQHETGIRSAQASHFCSLFLVPTRTWFLLFMF